MPRKNVAIEKSVEILGQPALDADFSRARVPRFCRLRDDLLDRERISVGGIRPARESAKSAAHHADIREIYVAIDDVGDGIADLPAAKFVGRSDERCQIIAVCPREKQPFIEAEFAALQERARVPLVSLGERRAVHHSDSLSARPSSVPTAILYSPARA